MWSGQLPRCVRRRLVLPQLDRPEHRLDVLTAHVVCLHRYSRRYVTTCVAFAVTLQDLRYCRKYDLQTNVTTLFSLLRYSYMFVLLNMMKTLT